MARLTLANAKQHGQEFVNDVRAKGVTSMEPPQCARCEKGFLIPSSIMQISRTGRCSFCETMMGLQPDERAHVEYVVHEARRGNFAPMVAAC